LKLLLPAANPNRKFPMRQTRALSACFPAKTLKSSSQLSATSFQLSAFALPPLDFADSLKEAHSPLARQKRLKAES
jgi:hypothetical protein